MRHGEYSYRLYAKFETLKIKGRTARYKKEGFWFFSNLVDVHVFLPCFLMCLRTGELLCYRQKARRKLKLEGANCGSRIQLKREPERLYCRPVFLKFECARISRRMDQNSQAPGSDRVNAVS